MLLKRGEVRTMDGIAITVPKGISLVEAQLICAMIKLHHKTLRAAFLAATQRSELLPDVEDQLVADTIDFARDCFPGTKVELDPEHAGQIWRVPT